MIRPSRIACFFMSGAVVGLAVALIAWTQGWKEAFMNTAWLIGIGAAGSILTWRDDA